MARQNSGRHWPSLMGGSFIVAMVLFLGCTDGVCERAAPSPPTPSGARNALCDGSDERRLLAQYGGSGAIMAGSTVLTENGYDFLVVDGHCHFWVQRDGFFGDVREGYLDEAQANHVLSTLRLDSWSNLAGGYTSSLCDGPGQRYRYGAAEISIVSRCGAQPGDEPVSWLRPAPRELLVNLHSVGTPARDGVRYTLVENDELQSPSTDDAFRNAPAWPLPAPASELAISAEAAASQRPGESRAATGKDAQCLQGLAEAFREGTIGSRIAGFAPTISGGRAFRLFVRDSVPFEDASGLWTVSSR